MYLFSLSILYLFTFVIQGLKELYTNNYDHDIDQFMYFGSRIIEGELIWTKEFDDKSPVLQFLFAIPAYFKSTSIWVLFTILIAIIAAILFYFFVFNLLIYDSIKLERKKARKVGLFCSCFYLALQAYIYGSLIHINSICSSLNLIAICLLYLDSQGRIKKIYQPFSFPLASISATVAISIRPYLLCPLIFIAAWVLIRKRIENYEKSTKDILFTKSDYFYFIKWILSLLLFVIALNLLPYIISGSLDSFIYGIKLNSIDYVEQNIFIRQYVNIGRNPILYPVLLSFTGLPFLWFCLFRKKLTSNKNNLHLSISTIDVDILFFTIASPILLEISFLNRHFYGHYFNLFSPYAVITTAYIIALSLKYDALYQSSQRLRIFRNTFITIILSICLLTDRSIPDALSIVIKGDGFDKKNNVSFVNSILKDNNSEKRQNFLFPESNYVHWKLSESRHGFPQAIVYRNIREGKLDKILDKYQKTKFSFLLPNKKALCKTLIDHAPTLIITREGTTFTHNCLITSPETYQKIELPDPDRTKLQVFKRVELKN